jgi:hypothetical protein
VTIVEEVGMVHKDLDRFFGAKKKVPPVRQSEHKSKELAIPDIIVLFRASKGL